VLSHGGQAAAAPPQASAAGITICAADATSAVVVPDGMSALRGTAFGSRAYGRQVRLAIVRAADGATLFTGSRRSPRCRLQPARSCSSPSDGRRATRVGRPAGARLYWS
jgi:hypothetical protein